jgi:pimeloyl-ACP methyl ester carboxylesterase
MDGTGRLFRGFAASAPPHASLSIHPLPAEPLGYREIADRLAGTLCLDGGCVIVAESFSGPLAVRLAAEHRVRAVVLCNSFVAPPRRGVPRALAAPLLFRFGVPRLVIRGLLLGMRAPRERVEEVRSAIAPVPPAVLASRLANVLGADETGALARISAPLLYLRGTEDRLVPEGALRRITAVAPARVARIPGPHLLLQVEPRRAWEAILRFLAMLPPPEATPSIP